MIAGKFARLLEARFHQGNLFACLLHFCLRLLQSCRIEFNDFSSGEGEGFGDFRLSSGLLLGDRS